MKTVRSLATKALLIAMTALGTVGAAEARDRGTRFDVDVSYSSGGRGYYGGGGYGYGGGYSRVDVGYSNYYRPVYRPVVVQRPVYYPQPVYVQPAPVYYPQPVYVQPPVVVQPQPVYVPPVVVQPQPVYVQPQPVYNPGYCAPGGYAYTSVQFSYRR